MSYINLSLYIHIPFCYSKCPYCGFYSIVDRDDLLKNHYINALKKEIEIYSKKYPNITIKSIYLGGGTPTILSAKQISEILNFCYEKFNVKKYIEITIESNPATFDYEKAKIIFQSGINRLSIGAQAFNNKLLKNIGRIHHKKEIINSFEIARSVGFKNINLDVMFGLPGQTISNFNQALEKLVEMHPEHISLYGLSIEPGTPFEVAVKKRIMKLPSDDITYKMYQKAIDFLKSNGYEQYEISNFSLTEKQCLHNKIYWKNHQYLGLGPSATSYVHKNRFKNISNVIEYIHLLRYNILPVESKEILPLKEEMAETVILHLRMMEGINSNDFKSRFKIQIEEVFGKQFNKLIDLGLLDKNETNYFLNRRGIALSNIVFIEFLD